MRKLSPIWSPMLRSGFSAVIGSWKIMAMRAPRRRRISASDFASRSSPASSTCPAATRTPSGSRRITALAVMDLPEPLSPTTQRIFPFSSVRVTSWRA